MPEYIGRQLGNYRIIRLLGEGGFAQVYLGEHIYLKTTAAIKVLLANLPKNDLQVFLNEARIIARLRHPQIVRVLEFGIDNGNAPYLVMTYAPDGTLRNRHPRGSIVPQEKIVAYVKQVAAALQYAHDQRLVHRDVKPENMLIGRNNEILLSDFGIAIALHNTLSQNQTNISGTVAYMAPEQLQGKPRPASDQYSLGVVVYEWLCGSRPFEGSNFLQIAAQHLQTPPPPLHERLPYLSLEIEEVVMRSLAKEPTARFPSVQAFADALANVSTEKTSLNYALSPTSTLKADLSGPFASLFDPAASTATTTKGTEAAPLSETLLHNRISRRTMVIALASAVGLSAIGASATWYTLTNVPTPLSHTRPTIVATKSPTVIAKSTSVLPSQPVGTTLMTYSKHTATVTGLAWSPDGSWLASSSTDKTVSVWPTVDNTQAQTFIYTSHTDSVVTLAWSPNGQYIASGSKDKTVRVWYAPSISQGAQGKPGDTLVTYQGSARDISAVAWSPDNKQIASTDDAPTMVQTWDATTGKHATYYPDPTQDTFKTTSGPANTVVWSFDGRYIASSIVTVAVWDVASGSRLLTYGGYRGSEFPMVHGLAWMPGGIHVASAGEDKTVQVWNAITGATLFTYQGHSDAVYAVAWSPDGKYLASASHDTTVQVCDATTGKHMYTYPGHTAPVNAVVWAADSRRIASAGDDKKVLIWQGA